MTCKDCVHYEACKMILLSAYPNVTEAEIIQTANNQKNKCVNFKDKTRFVELPCKVGDTVYVPFNEKVHKANVFSMKIETEDKKYIYMLKLRIFGHFFQFKTLLLGKNVFLTREEAEKALERNKER